MVKEHLKLVEENIQKACEKAGRDRSDVTLIAVSKTKPVEMLQEAYDAGARDFGENKVQEMMDKIPVLPEDIRWHMIGHLQRNKVKYVVGQAALIHSVDTYRLAEEINIQAHACIDRGKYRRRGEQIRRPAGGHTSACERYLHAGKCKNSGPDDRCPLCGRSGGKPRLLPQN